MFESSNPLLNNVQIPCHIYVRVSTKKQVKEGLSIENQKNKCIEFANNRGWTVVGVYVDEGKTGKNTERPGFKKLMAACRSEDKIVVYSMSRLGRNSLEMAQTYQNLKDNSITICSVSEKHVDDSTAMGKFYIQLMFSMAEWELNETTSRSKVIIDNKKMCGEMVSNVGFGYKIHRWIGRKYVYPIAHEQAGLMFLVNSKVNNPNMSWADIGESMSVQGWHPVKTNRYDDEEDGEEKSVRRKWKHSTLQGMFNANKKRFLNGAQLSLRELRKYEDYKVPLCVKYSDIDKYIVREHDEFNYLACFGHVYGISGVHIPDIDQMQRDIKDGRLDNFPSRFKEDIKNAAKYGVEEDGTPKFDIRDKTLKYFMTSDVKKLEKFFAVAIKRKMEEKTLNDTIIKYFNVPQEVMEREKDSVYDFLILCEGMSPEEVAESFVIDY